MKLNKLNINYHNKKKSKFLHSSSNKFLNKWNKNNNNNNNYNNMLVFFLMNQLF